MKTRKKNSEYGFTLIEAIITLVLVAIVGAMMTSYFGTSIIQSSVPIQRLQAEANLTQIMEAITAKYTQYPYWQATKTYTAGDIILPTTGSGSILRHSGLLYKTTAGGTSGSTEPTWTSPVTKLENGSTFSESNITWSLVWPLATDPDVAAPTLVLINRRRNTAYSLNTVVYPGNGYQYICIVAGTSSNAAISWPTGDSAIVVDGGVRWKQIGRQPTLVLTTAIGAENTDQNNIFGSYHVIHNRFIRFDSGGNENDTCSQSSCNMLISGVNTNVYGWYLKVTISRTSDHEQPLTTLFVRR